MLRTAGQCYTSPNIAAGLLRTYGYTLLHNVAYTRIYQHYIRDVCFLEGMGETVDLLNDVHAMSGRSSCFIQHFHIAIPCAMHYYDVLLMYVMYSAVL